jgi:hypothetical protein
MSYELDILELGARATAVLLVEDNRRKPETAIAFAIVEPHPVAAFIGELADWQQRLG